MQIFILFCLLFSTTFLQAQPNPPVSSDVTAFRQYLAQAEAARQQKLAQFIGQKKNVRLEYTDAKGAYHFLHHIDEQGNPVYYNTRSNVGLAVSINTSKLWSGGGLGLNLQGQGMEVSAARSRLGMWEPGPTRSTHIEFGGRALVRDTPLFTVTSGNTDHANHVAGTMMATGVNPLARGMANQARLDCYEIQTNELLEIETSASAGMLVSNHSYGPDYDTTRVRLGVYDAACRDYDLITFQNRNYLMFHAAGNDRADGRDITYDILIGGAVAKNVVTVGAVRRLDAVGGYTGPASVTIADFSSYGPTDDGRIKPDFVAPGVAIFSAYSANDTIYSSINGTSMASPGAAGSLFLLQQHYRNNRNTFMRAASLKGIGVHTAEEAGSDPGPDYGFGWGLLNLEKAINVINRAGGQHLIEEASLTNGTTYRKAVTTPGGLFKVTIAWTDVPGTPLISGGINNRTPMLINDLDVRIVDAVTSLTVGQLPWKLNPVTPAAAATRGDNGVDNVEQIFVDNLPAGQYVLQVTHKGTLQQGPQEFAIFATGISRNPFVSTLPNTSVCAGAAVTPLSFSVADDELASVTLTAQSSNTALVASASIVSAGSGANRTLTVTPTTGQTGTALMTVVVTNNVGQTATTGFTLTVNPVPSLSITANPSLTISTGQTTTLTASGADSFTWSTSATTTAISVSTGGTYSVRGTTIGCSATAAVGVVIQTVPCTVYATIKAGNWNDPTVWSCGIVPPTMSVVEINHVIELPVGYQAQALLVRYGLTGSLHCNAGSRLQLGM